MRSRMERIESDIMTKKKRAETSRTEQQEDLDEEEMEEEIDWGTKTKNNPPKEKESKKSKPREEDRDDEEHDNDEDEDDDEEIDYFEFDEEGKSRSKNKKKKRNSSSDDSGESLVDKIKALPIIWKAVIAIVIVFIVQLAMELGGGGKNTGDENIELAPQEQVNEKTVEAEDNATSNKLNAEALESCLMANPLSLKAVDGTLKVMAGSIDTSNGSVFCDAFQIASASIEEDNSGVVYVVNVTSGGAPVATKRIPFIDTLQPTYYLEGIEIMDPATGSKRFVMTGEVLDQNVILESVKESTDGMSVIYTLKTPQKNVALKIPRNIVL